MRIFKQCILSLLVTLFISCDPVPEFGRKDINWKKEWGENEAKLKSLAHDIVVRRDKKYSEGGNDFPGNFKYPFDDGFSIRYKDSSRNNKSLTITFYIDRGLLDHYSAFIFTTDSSKINELDINVANGGNDFLLEPNWYIIND